MISQYVAIIRLMIVRGGRNTIVVLWAPSELEPDPLEALSA